MLSGAMRRPGYVKEGFILEFLEGLEEKYGCVKGCTESVLGLSDESFVKIREILRGKGKGE
jgi:hypothetical protein